MTPSAGGVPQNLRGLFLTLIIAAGGGAIAAALHLPLAWLIGAMIAVSAAAIFGAPVTMPPWVRAPTLAVLGVFLGSAFTPDVLQDIAGWWKAALLVPVYVATTSLISYKVLRRAGYDRPTALYGSPPGGLGEMALLGDAVGADARTIVLIHATRILVAVTMAPLLIALVTDFDLGQLPAMPGQVGADLSIRDAAVLTVCGIVGLILGKKLRLPAAVVLGPMIASALAHGAGLTHASPPPIVIAVAQILIGANLGARFSTTGGWRAIRTPIMLGGTMGMIMTLLSGLIAYLAAPVVGAQPVPLFLALAPGGFSEMMLMALLVGGDTAFVASMHVLRIAVIVIAIPAFSRRAP